MDPKIDATDRRSEEPRSGTGKRAECDPDRWDIDGKADGMCAAAREVEGGAGSRNDVLGTPSAEIWGE